MDRMMFALGEREIEFRDVHMHIYRQHQHWHRSCTRPGGRHEHDRLCEVCMYVNEVFGVMDYTPLPIHVC